jgi:hypothetical protein
VFGGKALRDPIAVCASLLSCKEFPMGVSVGTSEPRSVAKTAERSRSE